MSPRAQATRDDAVALRFLDAAAGLIDASLSDAGTDLPARITSLQFPVALDWIRISDIVRLARQGESTASKKALQNRWATKDEFIRDAIAHTMLYRDQPDADPLKVRPPMAAIASATSVSQGVADLADGIADRLLGHPRAFLLAHLAPLLPRHPELADEVGRGAAATREVWTAEYPLILTSLGVRFRPDWPPERVTLALTLMLDGLVVRHRAEPGVIRAATGPDGATLFADTVITFVLGVIDFDGSGATSRDRLDQQARSPNDNS